MTKIAFIGLDADGYAGLDFSGVVKRIRGEI